MRLKEYDYSQSGWHFVTICTQSRVHRFGMVENQRLCLNDVGQMVEEIWRSMPHRFLYVSIDEHVVMPDHFHAILRIEPGHVEGMGVPILFAVMGAFKSLTTNGYIQGVKQQSWPPFKKRLWQRRYHERVIRGEDELARIRRYIIENPLRWSEHVGG